ncbi:RNA helicase [uncultured Desulfovibrio sp.]|uniref:RNA helicase n=1 Tax=uncultured Desulfovibrio sp. TaxID=167968 RepID=UPI002626269C|nr:RNA helicase [uncultured Desulfovibrio sp.]
MASTWVSYGELVDIIGVCLAKTLCMTRGGVSLYIPKTASPQSDLAKIVGMGAMHALSTVHGGEVIVVPNRRNKEPQKSKILEMLNAGASPREIALRLDVTQRYVEHVASCVRPKVVQASLFEV